MPSRGTHRVPTELALTDSRRNLNRVFYPLSQVPQTNLSQARGRQFRLAFGQRFAAPFSIFPLKAATICGTAIILLPLLLHVIAAGAFAADLKLAGRITYV